MTLLAASAAVAFLGAPVAAMAADPVKIAILEDFSGLYADLTGQSNLLAAQMAVEDFGGKVLDRPIEILSADHQNKADVASTTVRQWIDVDHVAAVMGLGNSAVGLAGRNVAREKGALDINVSAGSSDLSGKQCSPTGFHWVFDTYALAKVTGSAVVKSGGDTWFFITADYAFGQALERDTTKFVLEGGGKVLGGVRAPLNTQDFSSFLIQAQSSKAKIIGMANAGGDTINTIKQAQEFGIVSGGQSLAGLLVFITDVHALGLKTAQGLLLTEAWYWDQDDASRAWAKKFMAKRNLMPNSLNAGMYSAVTAYLNAVKAVGSIDAKAVAEKIRATPVNDFATKNAKAREDGRLVRDMYLYQVKTPAESKGAWDYYKLKQSVPGDQAYRPLSESECPLVKKS